MREFNLFEYLANKPNVRAQRAGKYDLCLNTVLSENHI